MTLQEQQELMGNLQELIDKAGEVIVRLDSTDEYPELVHNQTEAQDDIREKISTARDNLQEAKAGIEAIEVINENDA